MKGALLSPELDISQIVAELVDNIPSIQAGLNSEWLQDIRELATLSGLPSAAAEALLRSMAPSRISLVEALIEARMAVRQSQQTAFSLSVRPVNLSFVRRYGAESYSACTLSVSLRQSPALPRDSNNP